MGRYAGIKDDIIIDIETVVIPLTEAEVDEAVAEFDAKQAHERVTKDPRRKYKKEETIAKYQQELEETQAAERAMFMDAVALGDDKRPFSFEGKRMISVAVGIADLEEGTIKHIMSWQGEDPAFLVKGLIDYYNQFKDIRIIGWNLQSFDMAEIVKQAFLLGLGPKTKPSKWDVLDLCGDPKSPYRGKKLKSVMKGLGLEVIGDGADVAGMHERGEWAKLKEYNENDIYGTGMAYIAAARWITFF